jgi:hypothetical protein
MTTTCRILVSFTPLALLAACGTAPERAVAALKAERFGNSEWSEPVNLGGLGGADIWVSRRASPDSPWEEPVNLGPNVNSSGLEASPSTVALA